MILYFRLLLRLAFRHQKVQDDTCDNTQADSGEAEALCSDDCSAYCEDKHNSRQAQIPVLLEIYLIFNQCTKADGGDHSIQYDTRAAQYTGRHRLNYTYNLAQEAGNDGEYSRHSQRCRIVVSSCRKHRGILGIGCIGRAAQKTGSEW